MVALDSTQLAVFLIGFFTVTAFAALLGLATVGGLVARSRGDRLARHETVRTYYGRLALHH